MISKLIFFFALFFACSFLGKEEKNVVEEPKPLTKEEVAQLRKDPGFYQEGVASFYHTRFHGQKTAAGENYDTLALTAAHKYLPFQSKVKVINIRTGRCAVVTINDRGPFVSNRIIDLSNQAAKEIGINEKKGITRVLLFTED